ISSWWTSWHTGNRHFTVVEPRCRDVRTMTGPKGESWRQKRIFLEALGKDTKLVL
ncbi:hypothetical protein LEMLEM_LOCUS11088, partial [Lemmus lemmus]